MASTTTRELPGHAERKSVAEGQLEPGTVLQNRYQIIGVLGVGGMGSVYQARDTRFSNVTKLCAVKEMMNLTPDSQMRKLIIQNFEREANILATLDHPAVPEIFDFFSEGTRSFLVMEFISGQSLEQVCDETEGFLPEETVLDWAVQVSDVVAYLHAHKPNPIIFRDLKPSNIMLDRHGRIRMVDFGIAKVFQVGERGTMIGTEGFSPPEQYRGEAGPASDVYALGATLHALLTKQDPRVEPPFSFAERPIRTTNPAISPPFEAVITQALAYEVEDRFPSAAEMAEALRALRARQGLPIAPPGSTSRPSMQAPAGYRGSPDHILPLWSFKFEDEIRSTPCIADGVAYIGAYDNNLYAIDVASGEFVWKFATEGGVASSPTVWDGRVAFGSEDERLYAVNIDNGQTAWTFRTKGRVYSSPRVDYGHVFVGSDDHGFYAISAASGREAWRVDVGARVRSSPLVGDELLFFGSEDGVVHALGLNGKAKWRFQTKRAVTSSPALSEGLVVVGSQDWSVYAVDATSGWSAWRYRTRGAVVSSPAIHDGRVLVGSADGALHAIDLDSGRRRWTYEVSAQITSSPAIHPGLGAVYFSAIDGCVYSLDVTQGKLRWRFQSEGPIPGSPAVYEDLVLVGSTDMHLYALPA